jgi:hypothetical protein
MRRSQQQGVALVITLIMLSVVTVMAIIFLGVSRRERAAVSVTTDFTTARLMADSALARAKGQMVSHVAAHSNLFAYDLMVSTNFINPNGFERGVSDPMNVAYQYPDGTPLNREDRNRNLVNLWYDPRPPVFITTNSNPNAPLDFRFYLDINRNGHFETNGWVPVLINGQPVEVNGELLHQFMVGDPEWIGVLEHPEQPHSPTNRFVGRYAYITLPAGKSLDLNHIHNSAQTVSLASPIPEGYSRNQGVGSWEINLAAFFQSLLPNQYGVYNYDPTLGLRSGQAFDDARAVLNYRQARTMESLRTVTELFGPPGTFAFQNQRIDGYGDGIPPYGLPLTTIAQPDNLEPWDNPGKLWWGSDAIEAYVGAQDLFEREKFLHWPQPIAPNFYDRLMTNVLYGLGDTEYRYAYHTLLAQMGVDSAPANRDKLHLNYVNVAMVTNVINNESYVTNVVVPQLVTQFVPWTINDPALGGNQRLNFFTNAVDRMLDQLYGATLRDGIQVYPTNNYNAAVHRVLQVAANILDASTNRVDLSEEPFFPSVFRPLFRRTGTNLVIHGYAEVIDAQVLTNSPWIDLSSPNPLSGLQEGPLLAVNVHGVPVVIGAKKGWPNFNEFQIQTSVQITRRMEAYKANRTAAPRLHQSYEIGISNVFGMESWNSYTQAFPRALELRATNLCHFVLRDGFRAPGAQILLDETIVNVQNTNFAPNAWSGEQFQISSRAFEPLRNSEYWPLQTPPFRQIDGGVAFDETSGFPVPDFKLDITNRVTVMMLARDRFNVPRVVDFVTLDGLAAGMDISEHLVGRTNIFAERGLDAGSFWITNRLNDAPLAATFGITNQIFVSTNDVLSRTDWRSLTENPISGQQKEKAIDDFRLFMGLPALFDTRRTQPPPGLRVQVPFSPTRILDQHLSWQANDPLVHYHVEDLYDEQLTDIDNVVPRPPGALPPSSNIGRINQRYRPWGGRPGSVGDQWAFNVGVKDPGVRRSDDWAFPTNQFATIGYLGRVHRGTPWQTIYLKSAVEPVESWTKWAFRPESHPTNDWAMLELFTTAMNDNAARGLLSVNQENRAAWTAVLAGIPVLTNTLESVNITTDPHDTNAYSHLYIQPNTPQVETIVQSINEARGRHFNQTFRHLGHVLSAPALTVESPYLNRRGDQPLYGITDAMYEWIPQKILSLLREDEPYVVVYAYGQTLRPAERSLVTAPGPFYGLVTNYHISSEVLTKTALRLEEIRRPDNQPSVYRSVVKSHNILPAD